ncbi:hypothetical protein TNCV_2383701 [Trichonephila clavipes]|nr:hypothetical protein TNCV_2383701 [Trichonephila clavipes]
MVIPQWIINPYCYIEETDVVLQEELIGISTNEELKMSQFEEGDILQLDGAPPLVSQCASSLTDREQPSSPALTLVGGFVPHLPVDLVELNHY